MILKAIGQAIDKHKLLKADQTVVAAVSGGADSVAMLHILTRLRRHFGLRIHVASLHHGLRGDAAQADLDFVQQLAERWQIPCTLGRADVPRLAREGGIGIEEAARRARYDFLARVAGQIGGDCVVAAAHHADDQAETILMRIARGSGLRGLRGMSFAAPMPGHAHITLIRPLLEVTRGDLQRYCAAHGLDFRHDRSNDDLRFQRNFIRRQVMGRLRRVNPNVGAALARLAESTSVDEHYLSSQFESTVMPQVDIDQHGWSLSRDAYVRLHPAMQRRWIREALRRLGGESLTLSHHNTQELAGWAGRAAVGARRDLGGAMQLRTAYDRLHIEHQAAPVVYDGYRLIDAEAAIALRPPACVRLGSLRIKVLAEDAPEASGIRLWLPADAALCLRTRRPGERFRPRGMGGKSRKVKDWMIDRKIPRAIRRQIPLVCANGEIIAIGLGDAWHLADWPRFEVTDEDSAICLILD